VGQMRIPFGVFGMSRSLLLGIVSGVQA